MMNLDVLRQDVADFMQADRYLDDSAMLRYGNIALYEVINVVKPLTLIFPLSELHAHELQEYIGDNAFLARHKKLESLFDEILLPEELSTGFCLMICAKSSLQNGKSFQGRAFREFNWYRDRMRNELNRTKKEVWI